MKISQKELKDLKAAVNQAYRDNVSDTFVLSNGLNYYISNESDSDINLVIKIEVDGYLECIKFTSYKALCLFLGVQNELID